MSGGKVPGPVCQVENPIEIDEGTMCLAASPAPGPVCAMDSPDTDGYSAGATYEHPVSVTQTVSIALGTELTVDSLVRDIYNRGSEAIRAQAREFVSMAKMTAEEAKVWSNGQRNALMEACRERSGPLGRTLAVLLKPKGKTVEELEKLGKSASGIIESAGRTRPWVNRVAVGFRFAGPALLVVGLSFSAYDITTAPASERWQVVSREVGTWAGALAGGWAGGEAGAEVGAGAGTVIEPVGGTAVGGVVGAIVGGVGGAVAGGWAGAKAGQYVYRSIQNP